MVTTSRERLFIGIDPGVSGGIAAVTTSGAPVLAVPMPRTEADVLRVFDDLATWEPRAILERVHVMPKQGIVSAFTFGKGFGGILMALTATRIPFDLVTPQTWQTAMQCLSRGDKNVTKRRAQQLFPHDSITHAIADALLLAEFGRRRFS